MFLLRSLLLAALLSGASPAAPLALGLLPHATVDYGQGPRRSLEELLAEERKASAARLEALRPEVSSLLGSLRSLAGSKGGDQRVALLRANLVALGPEITPLLVTVLDPPKSATSEDRALAVHTAVVLEQMPLEAVLDELIAIAESGGSPGRSLAVRVLGASHAPKRIGPILSHLFHDEADLRAPALRALCRLGGPDSERTLTEVLTLADSISPENVENRNLVAEALAALAETARLGLPVTPGQLTFLRTVTVSRAARELVVGLIDFASALPADTLTAADTERFIALVTDRLVSREDRIRLLDAMPRMHLVFERGMDKRFAPLLAESNPTLVEAGLICLARFGDKGAKKDLMKPYKDAIAEKREDPGPLEARGGILVRLGEYAEAILDYKRAIKLYADQKKSPYAANAAYTGWARALCLDGDTRSAAKALSDSSLSTVQLRALAKDPDFAALVADDKNNGVLRLP